MYLFVYVIGRHAVQFGNNFFNPIISKLDKHVVLLTINYRASKNSLFKAKLNIRAKTIQFILKWVYPIYFKLDSLQKLTINRYVGNIGF